MELSLNAAPKQMVGTDYILWHLFLAASMGGGLSLQATFGVRVGVITTAQQGLVLFFSF